MEKETEQELIKKDDWLSERGNNVEYYIPEVSGKGKGYS